MQVTSLNPSMALPKGMPAVPSRQYTYPMDAPLGRNDLGLVANI